MSVAAAGPLPLAVRVVAIRYEAEGIFSFAFQRPDGGKLPTFEAGAHIDIDLPGDLRRSYSLINPRDASGRYVIAVGRDGQSRGGSRYLCDTLRVGDMLRIGEPRNHFRLDETAAVSVLIGGGIGITPLWAMIQQLETLGRSWRLFYAARTRALAPFLPELAELEAQSPGRVHLTFDREPGQTMLDLAAVVRDQPASAHFYCCGPNGMLKAFDAATQGRPPALVHKEYFSSDAEPARGGFDVVLAQSGKVYQIPVGKTIMDVLLADNVRVSRSCMEGVCGTCETAVLEGVPDHRDQVLSKRERASNKKMMICCSGSLGPRLVLDM